ncbi:MAG: TldD/PmbA family protein [Egibacteraceae bacterium]
MEELAELALDEVVTAGATYADVRAVETDYESLTVQDERVEGAARQTSRGIGVRVIAGGSWGFAATARLERSEVLAAARLAVRIARASATVQRRPVRLAPSVPVTATWATPHEQDPFDVSIDDKLDLLLRCTAAANAVPGLALAVGSADAWRTRTRFLSSEGARIDQTILQVGAGVECVAIDGGEVQRRSFPNSFRGYCGCGGWEDVVALHLPERTPRCAEEAVALLSAPDLPASQTTLIIDGSQLALQVHESVGHPLELDRILGFEAAYAGTSFVDVGSIGALRYGSPLVNLTLDSTTPKAMGTFGFDDEGTAATRAPLVVEGVLRGVLSSRETAPALGNGAVSNATMRADSWAHIPLIRMSNIHLEPGDGTLDELLSDTGQGVFMTTNRSWSIDDKRVNFQFGCEMAFQIRGGRLGRMYRNPTYAGRTTDFWGSCDAIAGTREWRVYGTPNCGKGQPPQVARVAHGASPGRFRHVTVGTPRATATA